MSDRPLYRIKDWAVHFETHESRQVKRLSWVAVKNKHDGKGYRRLAGHERRVDLFCAWSLIIQVASKMPERGLLRDEDGPLTADDMAVMTGFPEEIFALALAELTDGRIGWLEVIDPAEIHAAPDAPRMRPGPAPGPSRSDRDTGQERTEQDKTKQNRRGSTLPHLVLSNDGATLPSPPPASPNAAAWRQSLLALLRKYGATMDMKGESIFAEWCNATSAYDIDFIANIFQTENPKPHLPSLLRAVLKRRSHECSTGNTKPSEAIP